MLSSEMVPLNIMRNTTGLCKMYLSVPDLIMYKNGGKDENLVMLSDTDLCSKKG